MLTLTQGASSVVVAPEHGASLLGWMVGHTPILRRALPQAVRGDRHATACFPLLPYCNRIGMGRFGWHGRQHALRGNFGDSPHTIHGVGWQRPWQVEAVASASARLALVHQPDADWPWAFDAGIAYALSANALDITLTLTNRHDAPVPAGIGLHPYFPKAGDPSLRFNAKAVWRNGDDDLPRHHGVPPSDWRHKTPRRVVQSRLDNCFTGWDGSAEIHAGAASVRIDASGVFRNLQVFTPPWADFFCVEPISHVPDAINRPELPADQGLRCLSPGEALGGTVRLVLPG